MDGFERRKARSKEDILRAAEELFSRFGADKVSINDIARKARVSQQRQPGARLPLDSCQEDREQSSRGSRHEEIVGG
jgi:hypothetical protein